MPQDERYAKNLIAIFVHGFNSHGYHMYHQQEEYRGHFIMSSCVLYEVCGRKHET
jgi:hypothetical protein